MNNTLSFSNTVDRTLPLRHLGDPVLSQQAHTVGPAELPRARQLAPLMLATMNSEGGIGLAATQIGETLSLTVIDLRPVEESLQDSLTGAEKDIFARMPLILLNPRITSTSPEEETSEEGCLSLPDIQAAVKRPARVVFQAQSLNGEPLFGECGGLLARCLQHEIDHLNGITFDQRLTPESLLRIKSKLRRLKKNTQKKLKHQIS